MREVKERIIRERNGFIAALDQSGGSSSKTLELYGINKDKYNGDEEMFDLIHEMRKRILTSKSFDNNYIIGSILFEGTMNSLVDSEYTADYLWNKKQIVSFLKIDNGLDVLNNGVQLMKPITDLDDKLKNAIKRNIFGTKMRSVIKEYNEDGIREVIKQQFELAKKIISYGLVPIIEPEVDINSLDKEKCEIFMKEEIDKYLKTLSPSDLIMFKFTIPSIDNFYYEYTMIPNVIKVVALSGGYTIDVAVNKLKRNNNMIASFSRALLEGLNINQSEEEFDSHLLNTIKLIYDASINKENN